MNSFKTLTLASSLLVLAAGIAQADDAKVFPSFAQLTAGGYEVRSVDLIPSEDREAMVADGKSVAVFITLQHGASTAVCQFGATSWTNLTPASLEATDGRCSVYPPSP